MKRAFVMMGLSLGLWLSGRAPAAQEVSWLKLSSRFEYVVDAKHACNTNFHWGHVYLTLFSENGKLQAAAFRSWKFYAVPSQQIWLTADELRGIELWRGDGKQPWLERLTLNPRELAWLLYYFDSNFGQCQPSRLATLSPMPATLDFELDGIPDGIWVSYSKRPLRFSGARRDRHRFEVRGFTVVQTVPNGIETVELRQHAYDR